MMNSLKNLIPFSFFIAVFFFAPAHAAAAARFFLSPSTGSFKVGDTITTSVMIDSGGQSINAAEGSVSFSSDLLTFDSVSTQGSIFTFWTSGPSGSSTVVNFGGGLSNPGYTGSSGKVVSITWKAKANGVALVSVVGTKILANDGSGTNIYGSSSGGTFTIGASSSTAKPKSTPSTSLSVKSSSHPSQDKWYNTRSVNLSWSGTSDITGYSFTFDQSSSTDPSATVSKSTSQTYENVADGVGYFHIKGKTATGFTSVIHFKIQIDTKAPDEFTTSVAQDVLTNPRPVATFEAKDSLSGIEKYEGIIDSGESFALKSGDQLPKQKPGAHTLKVKAFDKAGNTRESQANYKIEGIAPPIIIQYPTVVGLLSPIHIIGQSKPDDTIIIYLGDKEVGRFVAKDKQISVQAQATLNRVAAKSGDITWEYVYTEPLFPNTYEFKAQRIDANGAESELTPIMSVRIASNTIQIAGKIFDSKYVLFMLLIIIGLLLTFVVILLRKLHTLAVSHGPVALQSIKKQMYKVLNKTEKEIISEIDHTVPNYELSKGSVKDVKETLKKQVHETIEKEEKNIEQTDK